MVVALLVALLPLSLLAANPFDDLTGGVHDGNIDAIYTAGITTGCVPNASYCPTDTVTRQEMASFLARTAGLGTNPPVANAKTAQTAATAGHASTADNATNATNASHAGSADTATNATSATNAQNAVTAQTAANATSAGNANTVGGYAPSGLVRVARASSLNVFTVTSVLPAFAPAPGATLAITVPGDGFVLVTGAVTVSPNSNDGTIYVRLRDTSPGAAATAVSPTMFFKDDNDAAAPTYASGGLSPTFVFPVTGAGTKTFVIELAAGSPGAHSGFATMLTALYVPFGSGGAGALGGDEPPAPPTDPLTAPRP